MARASINSVDANFSTSLLPTGRGVIIDLGTGDGRFVYQWARRNPGSFYIGIDASAGALRKVSEKVRRSQAKGAPLMSCSCMLRSRRLPAELDGVADEVHVHFPWGSLLRALAIGDHRVLGNLRRICAPGAWLEVVISLDSLRDRSEITRLGLDPILAQSIPPSVIDRYHAAGFEAIESGVIPQSEWPGICTSWAGRLSSGTGRSLVYLVARAAAEDVRRPEPGGQFPGPEPGASAD